MKTLVKFNDLSLPNKWSQLEPSIMAVVEQQKYILGPNVQAFEHAFCQYEYDGQIPGVIGVASGTDALEIAFDALVHVKGWELRDVSIISVANSAPATLTPFLRRNISVEFCDVDQSGLMDMSDLKKMLLRHAGTDSKVVILPVDLYGQIVDVRNIKIMAEEILSPSQYIIIQDSAQGSGIRKRILFADAACFSFYPTKNLGAIGDGGAIAFQSNYALEAGKMLRMYGYGKHAHTQELLGYNSRLDEMQAAILLNKLRHLDEMNGLRKEIANIYDAGLNELIKVPRGYTNNHIYPILVWGRDMVQEKLLDAGIETGIHYPVPTWRQPFYQNSEARAYCNSALTLTKYFCDHELSLPIWPGMSELQARYVVDHVNKAIA